MAISCNPNALPAVAACFQSCIPEREQLAVQNYLWCQVSGVGLMSAPLLDISGSSSNGNTILLITRQGAQPDVWEIWRQINGGGYSLIASIPGNLNTWTDTGVLADGDEWDYQVRPVKNGKQFAFSTPGGVTSNTGLNPTGAISVSYPNVLVGYGLFGVDPGDAAVSFSAPRVHTVTGSLNVAGLNNLTTVSVPNLTMIGLDLECDLDFSLISVSFPALATIGRGCYLGQNNDNMVSFSLPSLRTVGAQIDLVDARPNVLASISFPSLVSAVDLIDFSGRTQVTSSSFPNLVSFAVYFGGGDFQGGAGIACTNLTLLTVPSLIIPNGTTVDFNSCALNAASVNSILRRGVISNCTGATITMSGGANSPPTGQGIADKATLIARGNNVGTN